MPADLAPGARPGLAARLWRYQAERFPLIAHGPLIAVFAVAAVAFGAAVTGAAIDWTATAAAGAILLGFFFQLRVCDEVKDAETDALHRPGRPVPRGLVTLGELVGVAVAVAIAQLALTLWLGAHLVLWLTLVWAYGGLMALEFGARHWLRARPVLYLLSHLLIVPLFALFAVAVAGRTSTEPASWLAAAPLLALAFANAAVLEIGRKIKAPQDEQPGVETYSGSWGLARAVAIWIGAIAASGGAAAAAGATLGMILPILVCVPVGMAAVAAGVRLVGRPAARRGRWVEAGSGLWALASFGAVGAAAVMR